MDGIMEEYCTKKLSSEKYMKKAVCDLKPFLKIELIIEFIHGPTLKPPSDDLYFVSCVNRSLYLLSLKYLLVFFALSLAQTGR